MAYEHLQQALEKEYQLSLQRLSEQIADRQRAIAEQVTARGLFGGGTHLGELSALGGEEARARGEIETTRLRQLAEIIKAREEEERARREARKALRGQMLAKLIEVGVPLVASMILPGAGGKIAKFGLPLLLGGRQKEKVPSSTPSLLPKNWQESLQPKFDIGPVKTSAPIPPFEWQRQPEEPIIPVGPVRTSIPEPDDISKLARYWVERKRETKERSLSPAYRNVPIETPFSIIGNKLQGTFRPKGRRYSLLPEGWQRNLL